MRRDRHGVLLRYCVDAPLKALILPQSDRDGVMLIAAERALKRLAAIIEALEPNERGEDRALHALHELDAALGLLRARLA